MKRKLVPDALWEMVEPLLPRRRRSRKGGRPRIDDRVALTGIIFVLKTGIPWEDLPQEIGCSGMTCWRRLRDWQKRGIWKELHKVFLQVLEDAGNIDWSRAIVDSATIPAPAGGKKTGRNPTDRGKAGTKHHLIVDRQGIPLAGLIGPANENDTKKLLKLVDSVPALKQPRGRPRRRPKKLHADKAYDFPVFRRELRARGIQPRIARRGIESKERLGRYRWVVERTISWVHRRRRLRIRWERRDDIHEAFFNLANSMVTWRYVNILVTGEVGSARRFC